MRAQRIASCDEGTPLRTLRRDHNKDAPPDHLALVAPDNDAVASCQPTTLNNHQEQEDLPAEEGDLERERDMLQSTATTPPPQACSAEVVHYTSAQGHVVRVVCLSDTHWEHRRIRVTDGDILIHCGDFSTRGPLSQVIEFNEWLGLLPHKHKIVIAGNHEMSLDELKHKPEEIKALFTNATYLQDDEVTVEGIRIYGAPWIARNKFFLLPSLKWALSAGIGKMGLGFAMSSKSPALYEKWNRIPEGVDFLVTHMPPYQILDSYLQKNMGCPYLEATVLERVRPVVHMFGHVHDSRGTMERDGIRFINAANALELNQPSVSFDYDVEARKVLAVYDAGHRHVEPGAGDAIEEERPHMPLKRVGSAPLASDIRRRSSSGGGGSSKQPHNFPRLTASHDTAV